MSQSEVEERLRAAVGNGVTALSISNRCGITAFRIRSVLVKDGEENSYRCKAVFTDAEVASINKVIDEIKAAL